MAQVAHCTRIIEAGAFRQTVVAAVRPLRRVLGSIHDALLLANQRQAERDIARFVSTHGKFTDSVEREISNMMLGDGLNPRR
ncbi:MAG TPA: hypothetical protein VIJ78_01615 [Pseudolabrys sp.]